MPPAFLNTIEQTAFSTWLRDSQDIYGFWLILSFHAIGMGLLVGSTTVVNLRVLGVARGIPLYALRRVNPLIWSGFWVQIVTGLLLLAAYPTKSFTAPVFYVKLACIAGGTAVAARIMKTLPMTGDDAPLGQARGLAIWSLVLWFGAVAAGRFIAYTAKFITYPIS